MSEPRLPGPGERASSPPVPWKEGGETDRAAELVKLVSGIAPRQLDVAKGWDDVIERVARPKSSRLLWFAAAAAAVLLAWVSLQWPLTAPRHVPSPAPAPLAAAPECEEPLMCMEGPPPARVAEAPAPSPAPLKPQPKLAAVEPERTEELTLPEPELPQAEPLAPERPTPEHVVAAAGAVWSVPVEGTLKVERGHVEVSRPEQYTVTTPEVSLVAGGARYAADVTEAGTVVRVFEGEVEVFALATRAQLTLRAGEERSFAAYAPPSALDVVPPEVSNPACARHSLEQRVACLATEGKGVGLRAQAALYEVAYLQARAGRAAGAELTLRESLRRFPHGVLHPEVRLALMKALVAQKRHSDAAEVGREFLAACPDDPRAPDLEAFLRMLEWLESR